MHASPPSVAALHAGPTNSALTHLSRMQSKLDAAAAEGKRVRGLVFINPGNPTGQCLTRQSLEDLIKFAVDNEVVLMADEVYQPNIYQDEKPFLSARCAPAPGARSALAMPALAVTSVLGDSIPTRVAPEPMHIFEICPLQCQVIQRHVGLCI